MMHKVSHANEPLVGQGTGPLAINPPLAAPSQPAAPWRHQQPATSATLKQRPNEGAAVPSIERRPAINSGQVSSFYM